jgi:hypothetical protein
MKFNHIEQLDAFKRDLSKLLKRFPSLEEDLESLVKAQLFAYHKLGVDNHGVVPVEGRSSQNHKIFKVLKFACKSLNLETAVQRC